MLTREQEQELALRFRRDDDLSAARELVLSHLRFVVHIARGYAGYGLPHERPGAGRQYRPDEGRQALRPHGGVRLVSFAVHWIRAEIHEYVLRNWRLVKVATTKAQRKLFFNLRRMKKNLAWLSADETRAVASDLGVRPAEVTEMERRLSARDLSFDVGPEADDEEGLRPGRLSAGAGCRSGRAGRSRRVERGSSNQQLSEAMERLDDRSRDHPAAPLDER